MGTLEATVLNSFFSFFLLVFSTAAFAGPAATGWQSNTKVYDQGTPDTSDDKYQATVQTKTEDGDVFVMSVGTQTGSKALADQRGENEAVDLNEGEGTTIKEAKGIAKALGRFFGKKDGNKMTEIIASPEGDCIQNPTKPGCGDNPMEGKPIGTKGVKAN